MRKLSLAASLLLLMAVSFSACNQESLDPVTSLMEPETEALLTETDLDNALSQMLEEPEFIDASEDENFYISLEGIPEVIEAIDFPQIEGFLADSLSSKDSLKFRCKRIWDSIALTDTQKLRLKHIRSNYISCKKATIKALRALHKSYISKANIEKAKLVKAYKNGDITQNELKRKLIQLNTRTKAAIKSDQRRLALIKQLRSCHKTYLSAVKAVLSPAQWKAFIKCRRVLYRGL